MRYSFVEMSQQTIRTDFDRIASLSDCRSDHNPYERFLFSQIPIGCQNALEVGCGTGAFTRLLAERAQNVLAIDLSPGMIQIAMGRSSGHPNIAFQVADITETDLGPEQFDCIVSIATLHHMPQAATLARLKDALRPQGILLIHDLFEPDGIFDLAVNTLAIPVSVGRRLIEFGRLRPPQAVRAAWKEHERHDTYLTLTEVKKLCCELLPNATINRHLLWRYSMIWQKPDL